MAIDFDQLFGKSLARHAAEIEGMGDAEVEEFAERLYDEWMETPNSELLNETPAQYFRQYTAQNLCEAVLEYAREGKRIPDPLNYEIIDRRIETERILTDILKEAQTGRGAIAVIELLTELQSSAAVPLLVELASNEHADPDVADSAAEAAIAIGADSVALAIAKLPLANTDAVEDRLADIISNSADGALAFEHLFEVFMRRRDQRAFYAACLAKTGDARAIDLLRNEISDPSTTYYEYLALRDALEAMGELLDIDREFAGDSDYELLKELDDE